MALPAKLTLLSADESAVDWTPTTLAQLGKNEKYLEDLIVKRPELLGLATIRTGVRGPFYAVQQLAMRTPTDRDVYPDVVFFAVSGHVILVEVKLNSNPELRDRRVIAQIIDYASSLQGLDTEKLAEVFGGAIAGRPWAEVVATWFPQCSDPEELAATFAQRIQQGEVNLVIACDRTPPGLPAVIKGIATQSFVAFELDLAEITPYSAGSDSDQILFVPTTRLATEIVARTAVTIAYRAGDEQPVGSVQAMSLEQIEENVKEARAEGAPEKRVWTIDEIEDEFRRVGPQFALEILDFCKRESADGRLTTGAPTRNACFGCYVNVPRPNGAVARHMTFTFGAGYPGIYVYFNKIVQMLSPDDYAEFMRRLRELFGQAIKPHQPPTEQYIAFSLLEKRWLDFQQLMIWLRENVTSLASKN